MAGRLENPLLKKRDDLSSNLLLGSKLTPLSNQHNVKGRIQNPRLQSSYLTSTMKNLGTNSLSSMSSIKPNLFSTLNLTQPTKSLQGIGKNTYVQHGKSPSKPIAPTATKTVKNKRAKTKTNKPTLQLEHEDDLMAESIVYDLTFNEKQKMEEELLNMKLDIEQNQDFIEKVDVISIAKRKKEELDQLKTSLINSVSIALLKSPKLENQEDNTRRAMLLDLDAMAKLDPEFLLKLALYTRREYNIRTVANFILARCAFHQAARPFIKKYFSASIVLPSDWISVAEMYQSFFDKKLNFGSLPAALRKAMIAKFPDFDEYQLAKYNKQKKNARPTIVKMSKDWRSASPDEMESQHSDDDSDDDDSGDDYSEDEEINADKDSDDDEDDEVTYELKALTLKQLVRKLHISQPAYQVMALIGKKYPETAEAFYRSGLSGTFDDQKAGKRMKLLVPETWETQVSSKGNKSSTWEALIDHRKLPFMAMLRNIRSMIRCGLKRAYHDKIIRRLTDEHSVINSKQFPFRFLSAYDILDLLEHDLLNADEKVKTIYNVKGKKKVKKSPLNTYNKAILVRYRKALDTALKISTIHNIAPISGRTIIILSLSSSAARRDISNGKGAKRTILQMSSLIAFMCKYNCEDSTIILHKFNGDLYSLVESFNEENILQNVSIITDKFWNLEEGNEGVMKNIDHYFGPFTAERKQINTILTFTDQYEPQYLSHFKTVYRCFVNPRCLSVTVVLSSNKVHYTASYGEYDVVINGFSDQILRYIAERGNSSQLLHVDNIDIAYELKEISVNQPLPKVQKMAPEIVEKIERPVMPWKTVRVFISSTFKDMHGERDLLTKYVFPELRAWCYNYCINVYEVDLRWGVTEKQAQSQSQLEICLKEVMKSDLFVGILGARYGWAPQTYDVSDPAGLEFLERTKAGCSITELEMRGFVDKYQNEANSRAFFYTRDNDFLSSSCKIPIEIRRDFTAESDHAEAQLEKLKDWLKSQSMEIYENYPCKWGGILNGHGIVSGLESFGQRVLLNLWNAIKKQFLSPKALTSTASVIEEGKDPHYDFAKEISARFVGRKVLMSKALATIDEIQNKSKENIVLITGKSGSGKTAFMSKLVTTYYESKPHVEPCCFFLDVGAKKLSILLYNICTKLNSMFDFGFPISENYRELKQKFVELLNAISKRLNRVQFVLFVDGLNQLQDQKIPITDWIPEELPKGLCLVLSCIDNTLCRKQLSIHKQLAEIIKVGAFEVTARSELVRKVLMQHGKQLDESPFNNQMKLLLSKKDASSPLYLKLACEELRVFGVYEKLNEQLQKLAQTVPQLVEFTLQRLEMENDKELVADAFSLFYHSREGLNEDELYETLNMLHSFRVIDIPEIKRISSRCFFSAEYRQQQIPRAYFLKMFRAIKIFLTETNRKGMFQLLFNDIIAIVESRYIRPGGLDYSAKVHACLAGYYQKQADPYNNMEWKGSDRKALAELPYHMSASGILWDDLKQLLCSLNFMQAKVNEDMCLELLEDFQIQNFVFNSKKIEQEKTNMMTSIEFLDTKEFISENIHVLSNYPMLLMQQAMNSKQLCDKIDSERHFTGFQWLNRESKTDDTASMTLTAQQPILCISLSKDESMIACGMADGEVVLFDKNTTKELRSFHGHAIAITSCSFAGTWKLCSASQDGVISVWDVNTGHRLHVLKKHKRQVSCCQATKDGRLLLSTSWDYTAKLWNLSDGTMAGEFTGHNHPFNCVALDVLEKHAALGSWKGKILIWNILENKKVDIYKGHEGSIRALAYSPSGRHLASATVSGQIILWSTQNATKVGQMSCQSFPIKQLTYTASGMELVAASSDKSVKVWSGNFGTPEVNFKCDSNIDVDLALSVVSNGEVTVIGYNSGKVVVLDKDMSLLRDWMAHTSPIRSLSFIQNEDETFDLLTASEDRLIKRWKFCRNESVFVLHGHTAAVKCVRAKQAYVLSASEDFSVRLWPGILFEEEESTSKVEAAAVLRGHTGIVTCCDLPESETFAISGSTDKTLIIWDLTNKLMVCRIYTAHADGITTCCWSEFGNYVVTGSNDFLIKVWDTKYLIANKDDASKLIAKITISGHTSTILDVKYKFGCIASGSVDGVLKIWTHKGVEITTLQQHKERINCCEIFADFEVEKKAKESDGNWLEKDDERGIQQKIRAFKPKNLFDVFVYTASDDGTLQSCRPFKPHLINELYGHADVVTDVVAGETTSEIISCSMDQSVKMWKFTAAKDDQSSSVHSGGVTCMASYRGSEIFVSGGRDGYIHLPDGTRFLAYRHTVLIGVSFYNQNMIVTLDHVGEIKLLSLKTLKVKAKLSITDEIVSAIAVPEDGERVIILFCEKNAKVIVFKKDELQVKSVCEWPGVVNVYVVPNSHFLAVATTTIRCIITDITDVSGESRKLEVDADSLAEVATTSDVNYMITGSSKGVVTRWESKDADHVKRASKKVHDKDITGLLVFDGASNSWLVTASKDCTLKVWQFQHHKFKEMKQVGLFHCGSPVTKLIGCVKNRQILLFVGDENGNVTRLAFQNELLDI